MPIVRRKVCARKNNIALTSVPRFCYRSRVLLIWMGRKKRVRALLGIDCSVTRMKRTDENEKGTSLLPRKERSW